MPRYYRIYKKTSPTDQIVICDSCEGTFNKPNYDKYTPEGVSLKGSEWPITLCKPCRKLVFVEVSQDEMERIHKAKQSTKRGI